MLSTIKIRILIEEPGTELMPQNVLYCTLECLRGNKSLIDSFLQVPVIRSCREIHIISGIDSCSSLLHRGFKSRNLIDRGIVAHNHSVEAYIITKNILEYV